MWTELKVGLCIAGEREFWPRTHITHETYWTCLLRKWNFVYSLPYFSVADWIIPSTHWLGNELVALPLRTPRENRNNKRSKHQIPEFKRSKNVDVSNLCGNSDRSFRQLRSLSFRIIRVKIKSNPLLIQTTTSGAHRREGRGGAVHWHPPKSKFKKLRFSRYGNIMWFIVQPKSTTEIVWWLVQCNFEKDSNILERFG
jgi:hypothetical protein